MPGRLVRRDTIESLRRDLLVRLVAPFGDYLAAQGVDLAALATPAASLRADAPLRALVAAVAEPHADMPPGLRALVTSLEALASAEGTDAVHHAAKTSGLSFALTQATEADLAALVLLDHPDVAREAALFVSAERTIRFIELVGAGPFADPPDDLAERLETAMRPHFLHRRKGGYVDVVVAAQGGEVAIELTHGDVRRTSAEIEDDRHKVHRPVRPARGDWAELTLATGVLRVSARAPADREAFRRALGEALAGDGEAFSATPGGAPLLDLSRLARPLEPQGGVVRAEATELVLVRPGRPRVTVADPVGLGDYLASEEGRLVTRGATVTAAKVVLQVETGERFRAELRPPNVFAVGRVERAVEDAARAYLVQVGVLREPPARGRLAEPA